MQMNNSCIPKPGKNVLRRPCESPKLGKSPYRYRDPLHMIMRFTTKRAATLDQEVNDTYKLGVPLSELLLDVSVDHITFATYRLAPQARN